MPSYEESYLGQLRKLIGREKIITPAIRAVIQNEKGQILWIRRKDNGTWGMPAGTQELGESIMDCLKREVQEETGLDVISATAMAIYSNRSIVTSYGDPYQLFQVQFLVHEWQGTLITETDETIDANFFEQNILPQGAPDYYQEVLADIQAYQGQVILK